MSVSEGRPGSTTAQAPSAPLPFVDLQAQRARLGDRLGAAIDRVLRHGAFVMGPEVEELESRLGAFGGACHVVTCASGTDALVLALMALGVGPGDAVVVPGFTFAASAGAVALAGATPVFADVRADTFNLDTGSVEAALGESRRLDLRPAAVLAVDLFGQPADYDALAPLCEAEGVVLVCDAAQSFGATWDGRAVGTFGRVTTTSFFPSKPLGAYGDGGAVLTDDDELAATIRSLRAHGRGEHPYDHVRIGMTGRLDTLQAAVLLEKLAVFPQELEARRRAASRYTAELGDVVTAPAVDPRAESTWAQYTIRVADRDGLAGALADRGVPTAVHYPRPLADQPAYDGFPVVPGGLPVAAACARSVLSLPMHAYLDVNGAQDRVIRAVRENAPRPTA